MDTKLVNTFLELVKIDSPSGYEQKVAKYIQNYLQKLKLDVKIDKVGNVLASVAGNKKLESLILTAHMDTVEPGKGIKPIIDKKGYIRSSGDTILGVDNKAAIAAIMTVVGDLLKSSIDHYPLELIFTTSEESGNNGAVSLDYSKIRSKKGYSFDSASEPLGTIITDAPFYNRFDVKITGKAAHAAKPHKANNALMALKEVLGEIILGKVSDDTLINIGILKSGTSRNTIPGEVEIMGEIRSMSKEEITTYSKETLDIFQECAKRTGCKIKIEIIQENTGFNLNPNNLFIQKTIKRLKEQNLKPSLKKVWSCFDANIFAEHGIMIVNMGYRGRNPHTTHESIKVTELEKLANMIMNLIRG